MSLHHPLLLSFDESLSSGARLYNRQQDALRRAAEGSRLNAREVAEAIDTYLRRMSETEIRRGPRRTTEPAVAPGQTKVDDMLSASDDDARDPSAA